MLKLNIIYSGKGGVNMNPEVEQRLADAREVVVE